MITLQKLVYSLHLSLSGFREGCIYTAEVHLKHSDRGSFDSQPHAQCNDFNKTECGIKPQHLILNFDFLDESFKSSLQVSIKRILFCIKCSYYSGARDRFLDLIILK